MSYRGDLWTWQQASFSISLLCRPRRNKNCPASVVNRELGHRLTANKNGFKRCFQGESVDPSKPPRFVYTGKGNRGAALSLRKEKGSPERGTTVRTLVSLRGRSRARVPHSRARCARQHRTHTHPSPTHLFLFLLLGFLNNVGRSMWVLVLQPGLKPTSCPGRQSLQPWTPGTLPGRSSC